MSAISLMRTTASTKRATDTADAGGGVISTFATHLPSIKVRVQDDTGTEGIRYMRETERRFVLVFAPIGTDIRAKDRIIVGRRTLDVQTALPRQQTPTVAHLLCECEETI